MVLVAFQCVLLMTTALSCCSAAGAGTDRLEVCGNLGVGGGTTPSLGLVRAIQRAVPNIPIMVSPSSDTSEFRTTPFCPFLILKIRLWYGLALETSCILKKSWT